MLWVEHPDLAWTTATCLEPASGAEEKGKLSVKLTINGMVMSIPGPRGRHETVSREELDRKVDNLVDLEKINEGIILHHVKTRFQGRKIYTLVGTILIAVNPYQAIPDLYKEDMMEKIRQRVAQGSTPVPHVFTIAANALSEMTLGGGGGGGGGGGEGASILISGESGSGKTETTKKLLHYLSHAASKKGKTFDIASAILDSNPILESFGNAKTLRNNNSSRFGKYMEVNYLKGERRGEIVGCKCISYLLEKSRVVRQTLGERNFHVFYMLLVGAESSLIDEYKLKKPSAFNFLNQSGCMEIDGRNDKEEFEMLMEAFQHVGFAPSHQRQILQCLAGILHLGNVQFSDVPQTEEVVNPISGLKETKTKEDESTRGAVTRATQKDLQLAARMLEMMDLADTSEVGALHLEHALCYVTVKGAANATTGQAEVVQMPLLALQAANNRDALAKACYDKLFDKIVTQVNRSLFKGRDEGWNIGVLDIFGFEVFETNSFEQLCINYCNEKLQSYFNDIIFDVELKYYQSEGIEVDDIVYKDNTGCVSLIDLKTGGIFTQVADIAVKRSATDDDLCKQLIESFAERQATKSEYFARPRPNKRGAFIVKHFAGDVTYCTDGFIEKNKDKLPDALLQSMEHSTLAVLNDDALLWDSWTPGRSQKVFPHSSSSKKDSSARNTTSRLPLASKFKIDLDSLLVELRKTVPQFVRCIKPNERQQPNLLDPSLTLSQLKYSGLFEAIRIRKSGYPLRLNHEQFLSRYKHCIVTVTSREKASPQSYARALMDILADKIGFTNKAGQLRNYAIGLTKVFIRRDEMGHALDDYREANSLHMATPIQKLIRGWLARRRFFKLVGAQKMLEMAERKSEDNERSLMNKEHLRCVEVRKAWIKEEARKRAALEEKERQLQAKREAVLKEFTRAALVLQRHVRGRRDRIKGQRLLCERMLDVALKFDTQRCNDCRQQRTCMRHHTRECNMLIMRHWLRDALASKNTLMLQEALQKADDSRVSSLTRCVCLHIQEDKTYRDAREALSDQQRRSSSSTGGGIASSLRPSPPVPRVHICDCRLILLKRAIARPTCAVCSHHKGAVRFHRCIKTRIIATLQSSAKDAILDTLKESYIKQQLRDAVDSGSDVLLQDALDKANASRMTTVEAIAPIYKEAQEALADHARLHGTLTNLQQDLARSISVPKLLSNVDILLKQVKEARAMGLGGEPPVLEALLRVGKIKSLVALRDRMRFAIELCAPSLMESAMTERAKLLPIFGPDLLEVEARGVEGMRRMLGYLTQIKVVNSAAEDDVSSTPLVSIPAFSGDKDVSIGSINDVMLPPYICKELCAMRDANPSNPQEVEHARAKFITLVPNLPTRKRFVRIFKWAVAFAPWRWQRQPAPTPTTASS